MGKIIANGNEHKTVDTEDTIVRDEKFYAGLKKDLEREGEIMLENYLKYHVDKEFKRVHLKLGDITEQNTEAIVNAANQSLLGGGGVDGAIHRAAGIGLYEECKKLHGCNVGEAKITSAYKLPCSYVIHTVAPIYIDGLHDEKKLLFDCYVNSLKVAKEHHIKSISFPSLGTGIYGNPLEQSANIAISAVLYFERKFKYDIDVTFVLFDEKTYSAYKMALDKYI